MDTHSNAMRTLARQLLALEAAASGGRGGRGGSGGVGGAVIQVCEKLQVELTKFAGADGFASLLRRAIAMARAEIPALGNLTIGPGCTLEGLEGVDQTEREAGAIAITANLLDLLATFIGEPLTLKLVREAWPELPPSPPHPPPDPQTKRDRNDNAT